MQVNYVTPMIVSQGVDANGVNHPLVTDPKGFLTPRDIDVMRKMDLISYHLSVLNNIMIQFMGSQGIFVQLPNDWDEMGGKLENNNVNS